MVNFISGCAHWETKWIPCFLAIMEDALIMLPRPKNKDRGGKVLWWETSL